jgi:hypothetical protein
MMYTLVLSSLRYPHYSEIRPEFEVPKGVGWKLQSKLIGVVAKLEYDSYVGTAELSHSSGIGARGLVVLLVPAAEASK